MYIWVGGATIVVAVPAFWFHTRTPSILVSYKDT